MQRFWQSIWFNLTHITFKGRTSKKEYLYWFLFGFLVSILIWLFISLPAIIIRPHISDISASGQIAATIYFFSAGLFVIIFSIWKSLADITMIVRRFHDFGKSAWFSLLFYWLITTLISISVAVIAVFVTGGLLHIEKTQSVAISSILGQMVFIISSLYFLFLLLFKKGVDKENKYGLPSELQK